MNYNEPLKIGIEITLGIIAHHGQLRAECFVDGACSPDVLVFRVNNDDILSKFLYYSMKRKTFFDYIMNQAGVNGIKMPRGNKDATMNFEVVVPSIADQQQIITQAEQYESAIRQAQAIMEGCAARKKAILDKYLN